MNTRTYAVRLRERGQITLPQPVRERLAAQDGDILNLVQIGDFAVLTTKQPRIPQLSQEFARMMAEDGVTLAELLAGLDETRTEIWHERRSQNA